MRQGFSGPPVIPPPPILHSGPLFLPSSPPSPPPRRPAGDQPERNPVCPSPAPSLPWTHPAISEFLQGLNKVPHRQLREEPNLLCHKVTAASPDKVRPASACPFLLTRALRWQRAVSVPQSPRQAEQGTPFWSKSECKLPSPLCFVLKVFASHTGPEAKERHRKERKQTCVMLMKTAINATRSANKVLPPHVCRKPALCTHATDSRNAVVLPGTSLCICYYKYTRVHTRARTHTCKHLAVSPTPDS